MVFTFLVHSFSCLDSNKDVKEVFKARLDKLVGQKHNFTLELANRAFVNDSLQLKPDFSDSLKQFYAGDVAKVNFQQTDKAVNTINGFVKDKTHGLIEELVKPDVILPTTE